MGVRSTKDISREARRRGGLMQEQMVNGICSPQALSRVEAGDLQPDIALAEEKKL